MRNSFRVLLAAFAVVTMVAIAGCNKDDINTNDNSGNGNGTENPTPGPNPQPSGAWVDLGLPSGLLWASYNVGATAPEEYGEYFAWGETQPKSNYNQSNYAYGSAYNQLIKYCNNADLGLDGFTDTLTILVPGDDAATALLGDGARIPTKEEWQELIDNTTPEWTTLNGVNGRRLTATNGNSIFLPAAGFRYTSELFLAGSNGYYWSALLYTDFPGNAWAFDFDSGDQGMYGTGNRSDGCSVRAVRPRQN